MFDFYNFSKLETKWQRYILKENYARELQLVKAASMLNINKKKKRRNIWN